MQFAKLQWKNQQPYSLEFDDVYYSSDDGLAETEYVFIQHNQLTERFSTLQETEFTIIETGFGTGLNFFSAVQHWLNNAPIDATLKFVSIERHPLSPADFMRASQLWPAFSEYAHQLQSAYSQLKAGPNQLTCGNNRVELTLWIGDINAVLPQIETTADAFFLDGFAPSKNETMWSSKLFDEIARLSKENTTFSTFTSAGQVRRNLQGAGFNVQKTSGFGRKREMLHGRYADSPTTIGSAA